MDNQRSASGLLSLPSVLLLLFDDDDDDDDDVVVVSDVATGSSLERSIDRE